MQRTMFCRLLNLFEWQAENILHTRCTHTFYEGEEWRSHFHDKLYQIIFWNERLWMVGADVCTRVTEIVLVLMLLPPPPPPPLLLFRRKKLIVVMLIKLIQTFSCRCRVSLSALSLSLAFSLTHMWLCVHFCCSCSCSVFSIIHNYRMYT